MGPPSTIGPKVRIVSLVAKLDPASTIGPKVRIVSLVAKPGPASPIGDQLSIVSIRPEPCNHRRAQGSHSYLGFASGVASNQDHTHLLSSY